MIKFEYQVPVYSIDGMGHLSFDAIFKAMSWALKLSIISLWLNEVCASWLQNKTCYWLFLQIKYIILGYLSILAIVPFSCVSETHFNDL